MAVAVLPSKTARDANSSRGTLRLYGPGEIDQLDPASAYDAPSCEIVRLFSRQLVTYAPRADLRDWQAVAPVPDVAVAVPSTYNAGLGASHRSYVLHLRRGVLWDTAPPRPVTAHDFVRGFKRMGNPASRSPALAYFTSAIRGMSDFCAGFAAAVSTATPTAEQLAAYQNAHEIPGVFALDDETLVIELRRPTPDFVQMLALTCASAAPVEYDAFVPGSPELHRNIRSNGPYRIASHVPGKELRLEPNPAWRRESDPIRSRHVAEIEITIDDASAAEVASRIDAGAADLPWASSVFVPAARRADGARASAGYALDPYLVFNFAHGSALVHDVRVRRAVAAAVDKVAVADVYRRHYPGVDVRVATSIVPPNNDGHDVNGLAVAGTHDPEFARALLAQAGYGRGLTFVVGYRRRDAEPAVAQSYAGDLEHAGLDVRLVELDDGDRNWDVATCRWSADWSYCNARIFLEPLFETGAVGNYGGYSDHHVDELIRRALEAAVEHAATANAAWREVERRVLEAVAVVPLLFRAPAVPRKRSARVRDAFPVPAFDYAYDLATVWLDDPTEAA